MMAVNANDNPMARESSSFLALQAAAVAIAADTRNAHVRRNNDVQRLAFHLQNSLAKDVGADQKRLA